MNNLDFGSSIKIKAVCATTLLSGATTCGITVCGVAVKGTTMSGTTTCGTNVCGGIVCASTCFTGSGAGLSGTASSLTVGTATNATCLGGNLATCYARKDQTNNFNSAITGTTICASTCFAGSGAGLTGTASSLTANNASCLGGNLANTYAPIASPNFTTNACAPKFIENGTCLASTYLPFTMATDQQDPTGFVDGSNINVSYNYAQRKITLTGTLDYYWNGVKKTLTSPWTSSAHTTTVGTWYLYSTDGTNITWSQSAWAFNYLQVALVNYKSTSGTTFGLRETHSMMPWTTHQDFHKNVGTYLYSGGLATSWTASTATNNANSPNFNSAVIADEDIQTTIAAITKGAYTLMRVSGATSIYTVGSTTPFSGATNAFIRINDPITGGWTAGINARYYNVYQFLVPTSSDVTSQKFRTIFLQPQVAYTTLASAQAEDTRGLYLGSLATESNEFIPYGRITYFTTNANTNYGKVTIPTNGITYVVGNRMGSTSMSGVVSPSNHANLTNLTWANSGHLGTNNTLAGFDATGNACSSTNLTFDGTQLKVTGDVCATTCVRSPLISGTTTCGSTAVCGGIFCATTCVSTACVSTTCGCVTTKLNINNPSITTRDLNVGANGIVNMGNFQMPNDKAFFFGSTSDSGTRYKLFTINCHAYMDFYDCLIIRSGPVSSLDVGYMSSGGTFCACQALNSPVLYGSTCSNSPLHCGACTLATTCVCSPTVIGSTAVCTATAYISSAIVGQGATYLDIYTNTVDGTDCKVTRIGGGGGVSGSRGGYISLFGNETATCAGQIIITPGSTCQLVTTAGIHCATTCFAGSVLCGGTCIQTPYAYVRKDVANGEGATLCLQNYVYDAANGATTGIRMAFIDGRYACMQIIGCGAYGQACRLSFGLTEHGADTYTERMNIYASTGVVYVCVCGVSTDWIATSDCRLKTCINPICNALSTVLQLQGVNYQLCDDENHENHLGLIAQDVQKVLPEIVSHDVAAETDYKYGICDEKLGLKYDKLTAVLVEAVKEQQKQIKEQEKQLHCLCSELNYWINSNYKT